MKLPFSGLIQLLRKEKKSNRSISVGTFGDLIDIEKIQLSYDSFFRFYRRNADVYGCIREIRQGVGSMGYKFFNNGEEIEGDETQKVDELFNSFRDWRSLKNATIRDKQICGNAFWHLVKNELGDEVVGIERIDPRTISFALTPYGDILAYIQRVGGYDPIVFTPDEIVHFKNDSDPDNDVFGFSPLEPAIYELLSDLSAQKMNFAFFENLALPKYLLLLNDDIDPMSDRAKNMIQTLKDQFKGADNAHKSGVVGGLKDAIKIDRTTQKDMEFSILRNLTTEKVCASFGVPKFKLGYTEKVNYNNAERLTLNFIQDTIEPLELEFAEELNVKFFPKIEVDIKIQFDPHPRKDDQAFEDMKAGVDTRKRYKERTNQTITESDQADPMFDRHVILNGVNSILLEDVGELQRSSDYEV